MKCTCVLLSLLVFVLLIVMTFCNGEKYDDSYEEYGSLEDKNQHTSYYRRERSQNSYDHHRGRGRRKPHKRVRISLVKMPSGNMANITTPEIPRGLCVNKANIITLNPNGAMAKKEYDLVSSEMTKTMVAFADCARYAGCYRSYNIIKIEKVVNNCLFKKYKKRQDVVKEENTIANERMLFHGTGVIDTIVENGFDERYSNSGMLGAGLYFADKSSGSNEFAYGSFSKPCPVHQIAGCTICQRRLLLCRVTLGKSYVQAGSHAFANPPPNYHSVEGFWRYPEYVVYRKEQAYPEYIITYTIVP